jgi:hypothetical protein
MSELPSAYPLRDLFDAAVRGRSVRLTCRTCRRSTLFSSHALWWLFRRKGWRDTFADVRKRCFCLLCLHRDRRKVRYPELDLVLAEPTDTSLPMPPEREWKTEVRRRR